MGKYYNLAEKMLERGAKVLQFSRFDLKGRRIEEVIVVSPNPSGLVLPKWAGEIVWALAADDPEMQKWLEDADSKGIEVPMVAARLPFSMDRKHWAEGKPPPKEYAEALRQQVGTIFCKMLGI